MIMKPIVWVGSSLEDLRKLPQAVRRDIGFALGAAQQGEKALSVKPLKGFNGASVLRGDRKLCGRHIPCGLYGEAKGRHLCASCV